MTIPLRFLPLSALLLLWWLPHPVDSTIRLPTFVADHMVLQRAPRQARIWGWTTMSPGGTIAASIDGLMIGRTIVQNRHAMVDDTTDDEHYWEIDLEPQPPSGNVELVLAEVPAPADVGNDARRRRESHSVSLNDIAFGDVYLCSGQSNMEMSVGDVFAAEDEIEDSRYYPHLRLATVQRTIANTTQDDVMHKGPQAWWRSGPEAVAGGSFDYFSAACYFAGRDVYKALGGLIPIGLVASSWGGQSVEAFSSPEALNDPACGGAIRSSLPLNRRGKENTSKFAPTTAAVVDDSVDGPQPTQLWYGMITPLLPMRFSGVLWYQGEANAGDPASYACRFPAMITDWRKHFGSIAHGVALPFFYVQLAAYEDDLSWIRAAQGAALELEHVSVAVAIDLGDPTSPRGSIHSRRKQEVGRRLALDILKLYDDGAGSGGPELVEVDIRKVSPLGSNVSQRFVVQLQLGKARNPVVAGTAACSECCYELPFETLDAATGNWTRVTKAIVFGNSEIFLEMEADRDDANVVGVRYGWEGYPQCALYDTTRPRLPMAPFQWCRYGGELPPWVDGSCDLGMHPVSPRQPTADSTVLLRGN